MTVFRRVFIESVGASREGLSSSGDLDHPRPAEGAGVLDAARLVRLIPRPAVRLLRVIERAGMLGGRLRASEYRSYRLLAESSGVGDRVRVFLEAGSGPLSLRVVEGAGVLTGTLRAFEFSLSRLHAETSGLRDRVSVSLVRAGRPLPLRVVERVGVRTTKMKRTEARLYRLSSLG